VGVGSPSKIGIGLLGCGIVGSSVVRLVDSQSEEIIQRVGIELEIVSIGVRSVARDRDLDIDPQVFTTDAQSVIKNDAVDVVVEVIGGIEPARSLILEALASGRSVVTANKELVANHGAELFAAADAAGVDLLFEAAVAGGIPLMRPMHRSLIGESITRVMGIVNGTTNYILTKMSLEGADYPDALSEAQRLGYAERDPTADVEGFDAGAKAAILATAAFGAHVVAGDVYHEGISTITDVDIDFADRLGYVIKLLAIAERTPSNEKKPDVEVAVRVHPAMVPKDHPLASVNDSFNAVFVEGEAVGELMFYGRGAGGMVTASAVLGDVIDAASHRAAGAAGTPLGALPRASVLPIDDIASAFYIHLEVIDRPGVLATVASIFGDHGVSIRSMEQEGLGAEARIIFITHAGLERDVQNTLSMLRELDSVRNVLSVLRVIGDDKS
jgi:homoserine dehydrogenase